MALASKEVTEPLQTFSITFHGEDGFDESPYAAQVAQCCGTKHHEMDMTEDFLETLPTIIDYCDEPFGISSSFALYQLSRYTSQHVKVVLSGDGGDEILAGYPRHFYFPKLRTLSRQLPSFIQGLCKGLGRLGQGSTLFYPWKPIFKMYLELYLMMTQLTISNFCLVTKKAI